MICLLIHMQRIREMETTIESEKTMMLRERTHLAEEAAACERERKALGELKVQLYEERRLFDRETLALTTIGSEVYRWCKRRKRFRWERGEERR